MYVDKQLKFCNITIKRAVAEWVEKYQSDSLNPKQTDAISTDAK